MFCISEKIQLTIFRSLFRWPFTEIRYLRLLSLLYTLKGDCHNMTMRVLRDFCLKGCFSYAHLFIYSLSLSFFLCSLFSLPFLFSTVQGNAFFTFIIRWQETPTRLLSVLAFGEKFWRRRSIDVLQERFWHFYLFSLPSGSFTRRYLVYISFFA